MTPDLLEQGARRIEQRMAALASRSAETESGGRSAGIGRIAKADGEVDTTHGRILYLEDVSVSFDGFKAINKLSLDIAPGQLDRDRHLGGRRRARHTHRPHRRCFHRQRRQELAHCCVP